MQQTLLVVAMPINSRSAEIAAIVTGWVNLLNKFFGKDEVTKLLLLDNSFDNETTKTLIELKEQYPDKIELIKQAKKAPHNEALINTYKEAVKLDANYVFQVNADASLSPNEFHKIWERYQIGKLVIGFRKGSTKVSLRLKLIIQLLFKVQIKDANIPYRLIQTDYLQALLEQMPQPLPICPNTYMSVLAKYSGMGLHNVPIDVITNVEQEEEGTCKAELFKRYFTIKKSARMIANLNQPV